MHMKNTQTTVKTASCSSVSSSTCFAPTDICIRSLGKGAHCRSNSSMFMPIYQMKEQEVVEWFWGAEVQRFFASYVKETHTKKNKTFSTCNLAKLVDKRQHRWYCWVQFEKKSGLHGLVWHLIQWQEHRMTATSHQILTTSSANNIIHHKQHPMEQGIKQ